MHQDLKGFMPRTIRAWFAIMIIMSWLPAIMYDTIWKPGVSAFAQWFFDMVTFSSRTLQNSIYTTAAVDPTSLPALIPFVFLALAPLFISSMGIGALIAKYIVIPRRSRALAGVPNFQRPQIRRRSAIRSTITSGVMLSIWLILSFILVTMVNESVLVWRSFHANVKICRPYITADDEIKFHAKFASIQSKEDYVAIAKDLKKIADAHGSRVIGGELLK